MSLVACFAGSSRTSNQGELDAPHYGIDVEMRSVESLLELILVLDLFFELLELMGDPVRHFGLIEPG